MAASSLLFCTTPFPSQARLVKGSETHSCAWDELRRLASLHRLRCELEMLESRLDCTECLARSPTGVAILSHCLDADLRRLCEPKMLRLLQSLWRLATIGEHGAHVEETTAIFLLSKPPRAVRVRCEPVRACSAGGPVQGGWRWSRSAWCGAWAGYMWARPREGGPRRVRKETTGGRTAFLRVSSRVSFF